MRLITQVFITCCALATSAVCAGTPELSIDCKGKTENITITGYPRGEGYDLTIKLNGHSLRYVDKCVDIDCLKRELQGNVYVVEALQTNVFTIYFSDRSESGDIFTGYFYAIPDTVKYVKTADGHRAKYQAIYEGADPGSNSSPKAFVATPIELICTQQETSDDL